MALLVIMLLAMLIGVPVAFSIGIACMSFIVGTGSYNLSVIITRMVDGINSYALLALPLFILAGSLMSYGSTPRLVRFVNMILGRVPGGMGAVGISGCAFFGAISGAGAAALTAIGGVVAPEMTRQNYKKGYTASLLATSSGLGVLIPPSIPMVLYCTTAGLSVGTMFIAGAVPGILIMLALIVFNAIICYRNGYGISEKKKYCLKEVVEITIQALPPLMMPVFVLGGVLGGYCTASEAAAVATVYSLFLAAVVYKELKWKDFVACCSETVLVSGIILFIIAASTAFSWLFAIEGYSKTLSDFALSISSNPTVLLTLMLIVLLIMGTFMDTSSIILLTTPLFFPLVRTLGINPYHYGVLLVIATNIGTITPPFAMAMFLGARLLAIKIEEMFPDILYCVAFMIGCLAVFMFFPQLSLLLV